MPRECMRECKSLPLGRPHSTQAMSTRLSIMRHAGNAARGNEQQATRQEVMRREAESRRQGAGGPAQLTTQAMSSRLSTTVEVMFLLFSVSSLVRNVRRRVLSSRYGPSTVRVHNSRGQAVSFHTHALRE